jgi:hypothetical protein
MEETKPRYILHEVTNPADLDEFYAGSALTFEEFPASDEGYNQLCDWFKNLQAVTVFPIDIYKVTGKMMDEKYGLTGDNAYKAELPIIVVKLSSIQDVPKIIVPRFSVGGRWFNDVVDNNARREHGDEKEYLDDEESDVDYEEDAE